MLRLYGVMDSITVFGTVGWGSSPYKATFTEPSLCVKKAFSLIRNTGFHIVELIKKVEFRITYSFLLNEKYYCYNPEWSV